MALHLFHDSTARTVSLPVYDALLGALETTWRMALQLFKTIKGQRLRPSLLTCSRHSSFHSVSRAREALSRLWPWDVSVPRRYRGEMRCVFSQIQAFEARKAAFLAWISSFRELLGFAKRLHISSS